MERVDPVACCTGIGTMPIGLNQRVEVDSWPAVLVILNKTCCSTANGHMVGGSFNPPPAGGSDGSWDLALFPLGPS